MKIEKFNFYNQTRNSHIIWWQGMVVEYCKIYRNWEMN